MGQLFNLILNRPEIYPGELLLGIIKNKHIEIFFHYEEGYASIFQKTFVNME